MTTIEDVEDGLLFIGKNESAESFVGLKVGNRFLNLGVYVKKTGEITFGGLASGFGNADMDREAEIVCDSAALIKLLTEKHLTDK